MASTRDLRKRIASVKNTQQTTKAMKMVSAAKLRRAQEAIVAQRPYAKRVGELVSRLGAVMEPNGERFPLAFRKAEEGRGKKAILVVVTSDRGLCGSFNSSAVKTAARWLGSQGPAYAGVELVFVGRKAFEYFRTRKGFQVGPHFVEASGKVTFAKARKLADYLCQRFLDGDCDEVLVVYNEFRNAISQKTQVERFLPLQMPGSDGESAIGDSPTDVLAKPSAAGLFSALIDKHFAIQAFRILLESQAGEHGARMSAMDSATRNAGDMIRGLTLQYNKQRQAGITKELLEIIAGSESQKET